MNAEIKQHQSGIVEVVICGILYIFTNDEVNKARRRGDSVLHNRKLAKGEGESDVKAS